MGVYLKPKVKLNDAIEIFGRVGYARVKGTVSGAGNLRQQAKTASLMVQV